MRSLLLVFLFTGAFSTCWSQRMTAEKTKENREQHRKELLDTVNGVLNREEIDEFKGLDYFAFDASFQINAKFRKSKGKKFKMPTSTEQLPVYRRYGFIEFKVDGTDCKLEVYQNIDLIKKDKKKFKNYVFIPFRDATSAKETYGGGRYLDIEIPNGETILIDFNQAYNPYCSYSHRYSCPIPPEQNTLNVSILAGEKTPLAH